MQATDARSQSRKKSRREFTTDTPRDVLIDALKEKEYKIRRMQGLFVDALQLLHDTERRTVEAESRIADTAKGLDKLNQYRSKLLDDTWKVKQETSEDRWWATRGQEERAEKTNLLSHLLEGVGQTVDEAASERHIRVQNAEALATARRVDRLWSHEVQNPKRNNPLQSEAQQVALVAAPVSLPPNSDGNAHHLASESVRSRVPSTPTTPPTYPESLQESLHSTLLDTRPRTSRPYRMRRSQSVSSPAYSNDIAGRGSLHSVENSCITSQSSDSHLESLLSEPGALPSEIIGSSLRKRRPSLTERLFDIGKATFSPSNAVTETPVDPWCPTGHITAAHKPKFHRRSSVDSENSLPPPVPPKSYPSTRKERLLLADDLRYGAAAKEISHYRENLISSKERDTSAYLGPDKIHREAAAMLAYPDRLDSRSPRTSLHSTSTTVDTPSRRSSRIASSTAAASLCSDGEPPNPSSSASRVGLSPQTVPSITVTPPSRTTSMDDLSSPSLSRKQAGDSSSRAPPPTRLSPDNRASGSPKHLISGPSNPPASLLLSQKRAGRHAREGQILA
ncbi:uncharacterized protein EV420DRAFT_587541 [Desarmillaria tabescens]|uniref:Uncharacterized protein n=1 Tax=Armillaria tabescens TaxID=1929756 RepID=A0AA39KAH4_ARMTA|nr:uncharacterized protein EV420DRAFT_587541 [Desarmillaria tabescens]KAK0455188.1 hypothetical protein EV420DRAFT_587541 [Desarmillaria tabescens]